MIKNKIIIITDKKNDINNSLSMLKKKKGNGVMVLLYPHKHIQIRRVARQN